MKPRVRHAGRHNGSRRPDDRGEAAVLARLRISVPDRPGSLGRVTSAIGAAGGDIAKVDVLESESGRALDDVFVQVRDLAHLDRLSRTLQSLTGVTIHGVQH